MPVGDGCWLVEVPPATGPRPGTDGDPTEPGPGHCSCSRPVPCSAMYLSVRPCCSKVCSHGLAVLQYPGSAHSGLLMTTYLFAITLYGTYTLLLPPQLGWRSLLVWPQGMRGLLSMAALCLATPGVLQEGCVWVSHTVKLALCGAQFLSEWWLLLAVRLSSS